MFNYIPGGVVSWAEEDEKLRETNCQNSIANFDKPTTNETDFSTHVTKNP